MPRMYRSMFKDGDKPQTGEGKNTLGVRLGPVPPNDITPDADGNVEPEKGGMSVAPRWQKIRIHLIPKRFCSLVPGARGSNKLHLWEHGIGDFEGGFIANGLSLTITSVDHGVVEPSHKMKSESYLSALAATQSDWREIGE
ncbi:MAG: hypothetical protein K8T91_21105 [Planctomycetes bacterium]|nr:hypothetical protein [Planctomycetota bacterium]